MKTREAGRRGGLRAWGRDFLRALANGEGGAGLWLPAGRWLVPGLVAERQGEVRRGAERRSNREQKRCVSFLRDLGTETTRRKREKLNRDTKTQKKRMTGGNAAVERG
ncbi:hypothetical protein NN561_003696 [Cricetulus griseus]